MRLKQGMIIRVAGTRTSPYRRILAVDRRFVTCLKLDISGASPNWKPADDVPVEALIPTLYRTRNRRDRIMAIYDRRLQAWNPKRKDER